MLEITRKGVCHRVRYMKLKTNTTRDTRANLNGMLCRCTCLERRAEI